MFEYDRIDISEGIDVDKTNQKNVCFVIIGVFLTKILVMDPDLCDGCYNFS